MPLLNMTEILLLDSRLLWRAGSNVSPSRALLDGKARSRACPVPEARRGLLACDAVGERNCIQMPLGPKALQRGVPLQQLHPVPEPAASTRFLPGIVA